MKRILIFFGGCSTEYEVSLQSAAAVLTHLDKSRYQPVMVGITRQGEWRYYSGAPEDIASDRWQDKASVPCLLDPSRGAKRLILLDKDRTCLGFDAAFPLLHGKNGEDGTLQGLLELAGIPLIGCGCLSSALCMDTDRAHTLAGLAGVRVPRGQVFRRGVSARELAETARQLGFPLFVKPVRAGSSFGVTRVSGPEQLPQAVQNAFENDREILLEEAVSGFEVGCAVLSSRRLITGAVDEIELSGGLFDFEEKYTLKTSAIHCPARIAPKQAARVKQTAQKVYQALDCKGFARVDLFLTPEGEILFNEVNTIPGFTAHSRYPSMMKQIGLDFTDLITLMIETEEEV